MSQMARWASGSTVSRRVNILTEVIFLTTGRGNARADSCCFANKVENEQHAKKYHTLVKIQHSILYQREITRNTTRLTTTDISDLSRTG